MIDPQTAIEIYAAFPALFFVPLLIGVVFTVVVLTFCFFTAAKEWGERDRNEQARLMVLEKFSKKMPDAELWQIIKDKGAGSPDGRIALTELKQRQDLSVEIAQENIEAAQTELNELKNTLAMEAK